MTILKILFNYATYFNYTFCQQEVASKKKCPEIRCMFQINLTIFTIMHNQTKNIFGNSK